MNNAAYASTEELCVEDQPRMARPSYAPADGFFLEEKLRGFRKSGVSLIPSQVKFGDRIYMLKSVFAHVDRDDDGLCFVSHPTLPVSGYGRGDDAAFDSFVEALDHQYRSLVECELNELSPSGVRRREAMERLVEVVDAVR